jgi:flavodoxin
LEEGLMPDRTLIICKSVHHQNTAKVARTIAEVLGADLCAPEAVDAESALDYDLIGFGSGVYFGRFHPALRQWIERLPDVSQFHHSAFVFSTAGLPSLWRLWHWQSKSQLSRKGFEVVGEFCCRGFDTVGPLWLLGGLNRGHPDERDLANAAAFAQRLLRFQAVEKIEHVC